MGHERRSRILRARSVSWDDVRATVWCTVLSPRIPIAHGHRHAMEQAAVPRRHRSSAIVASGAECVAVRSVRFLGHVLGPVHRTVYIAHVIRVLLPLTRAPIAAHANPPLPLHTCALVYVPRAARRREPLCTRAPFRFPRGPVASHLGWWWWLVPLRRTICVATPSRRRRAYSCTSMHGHSPTCEWINMKDRVQAAAWRQRLRRGSGRDRVREPACLPPRLPACPDAAAGRHEDRPCEAPPGRLATCGA